MLYNENLHEEEQHLIQQIAEQTERVTKSLRFFALLNFRTVLRNV